MKNGLHLTVTFSPPSLWLCLNFPNPINLCEFDSNVLNTLCSQVNPQHRQRTAALKITSSSMMATPNLFTDTQLVTAKIKQLTNEKLRNTLRNLALPTSGVKATLQGRLIERKS